MADQPNRRIAKTAEVVLCTLLVACSCNVAIARTEEEPTEEERIQRLERDIDELQSEFQQLKSMVRRVPNDAVALIFLFGIFCALWAQNTNRSPWLWFFMGALFNIITVLFLLSKNAADKNAIRTVAE